MPHSINRVVLLCGLLVFSGAAEGCQRGPTWSLASVEGTVTKDGRPLRHFEVVFLTDIDAGTQGPKASAFTDEAGHYRLRTDNGDDGTVVGKHRVLVLDPKARKGWMSGPARGLQPKQAAPPSPEDTKRPQEQQIPSHYGNFNETPLHIEVHPGAQVIDLDVK
jgi:hypothetical protein